VLEELFATEAFRSLPRIAPRLAEEAEIERVHDRMHVRAIAASEGRACTRYDPDTAASARSFEAAKLAAGASIDLADAILDGAVNNGFAALRPPGHHAERDRPMGFCLFNNVAIAARHLCVERGLERVLVLDWDVHHGNGTQHTFYGDPSVMYVSLHQYPFYPGTGSADEIGAGDGVGFTVNVPMPAGCGDATYRAAFRDLILPIARSFDPQFVLVSAGFDAHRDDPLASMALSAEAFGDMTDALVALADECCDGRIMCLLEGGYSLEALRDSVKLVLEHLASPGEFAAEDGELTPWGRVARELLAAYWKI